MQEEGHRIARPVSGVAARVYHPVRGRTQPAIGEPVEHVADVDHERAFGRRHRLPFALRGQQFEPGLFGAEQQRDRVDVAMRSGTNGAFGFGTL